MAKTIFLHIGANKTGSSAIQNAFNMNRQKLLDEGVLYPITGCLGDAHYGISSALGFAHGAPQSPRKASKELDEISIGLRREIAKSSVSDVVISSESFVLPRSVDAVREFFSGFELKIIVYVRRHDKWWPSAYNQAVRMVENPPWGHGFYSYMKFNEMLGPCSSRGAYRLLLDRWSAVFGKQNVIVRPYEAQQNTPNIIADFLDAIGYPGLAVKLSSAVGRVNDSLDAKSLAFVEMFQGAKIDRETRRKLIEYVACRAQSRGGNLTVHPGVLLRLVQNNQDDYAYIAREYLGRADGRLFYEPLPDPAAAWEKAEKLTHLEIVELMAKVLVGADDAPSVRRDCSEYGLRA